MQTNGEYSSLIYYTHCSLACVSPGLFQLAKIVNATSGLIPQLKQFRSKNQDSVPFFSQCPNGR